MIAHMIIIIAVVDDGLHSDRVVVVHQQLLTRQRPGEILHHLGPHHPQAYESYGSIEAYGWVTFTFHYSSGGEVPTPWTPHYVAVRCCCCCCIIIYHNTALCDAMTAATSQYHRHCSTRSYTGPLMLLELHRTPRYSNECCCGHLTLTLQYLTISNSAVYVLRLCTYGHQSF